MKGDFVFDEDMQRHVKAVHDMEECNNMKLTHFGMPVYWCLTIQVPSWSKYAPMPNSMCMGRIMEGEA
jgi:hypothetical protein